MDHNYYPGGPIKAKKIIASYRRGFSYRDGPERGSPGGSHDLNAQSHHHLNTTAFTPGVSMGAGNQLPFDEIAGTGQAYHLLEKLPTQSNALPDSTTEVIDTATTEYDYNGILLEYRELYFVIIPADPLRAQGGKRTIHYGFLEKARVDFHMIREWESLPKENIGKNCIAAADGKGSWYLYSVNLTKLRLSVAAGSRKVYRDYEQEDDMPSGKGFCSELRKNLSLMTQRTCEKAREEMKNQMKADDTILRELLSFSDDDEKMEDVQEG
ncbi:hypothetical protein ACEQ8H_000914 [Pleosporales sp. CAS-2024a]